MALACTNRELSTILAALRLWQEDCIKTDTIPVDFAGIATNAGTCTPLTDSEIDDLCETLNEEYL